MLSGHFCSAAHESIATNLEREETQRDVDLLARIGLEESALAAQQGLVEADGRVTEQPQAVPLVVTGTWNQFTVLGAGDAGRTACTTIATAAVVAMLEGSPINRPGSFQGSRSVASSRTGASGTGC